VLGVLVAVLVGVVIDVLTGWTTRLLRRVRLRVAGRRMVSYDPGAHGLFMLGEWSPARALTPVRLSTRVLESVERPRQPWVDEDVLADAVAASAADSGDISYLVDFRLDHRESEDTQVSRVVLAESDYAEVRAIERLRLFNPASLSRCDRLLHADLRRYLATPVPSSLAVNLIPVSADQEVLCAHRSAAVDNAVGLWTVGVFETLKRLDPNNPGHREDFYSLAYRALEEELGLLPQDCGDLHVTWVGLYRPILRGHVVALTKLRVPKTEIWDRARAADSSYEHANFEWLPLTRQHVLSLLSAPEVTNPGEVSPALEWRDRRWIDQARLALVESWRFRAALLE
jgi:hypothetical protein